VTAALPERGLVPTSLSVAGRWYSPLSGVPSMHAGGRVSVTDLVTYRPQWREETGQRGNSELQQGADTSADGGELITNGALCYCTEQPGGPIAAGWSRRGDSYPEPTAYKAE
jgi:hypothetical protein